MARQSEIGQQDKTGFVQRGPCLGDHTGNLRGKLLRSYQIEARIGCHFLGEKYDQRPHEIDKQDQRHHYPQKRLIRHGYFWKSIRISSVPSPTWVRASSTARSSKGTLDWRFGSVES